MPSLSILSRCAFIGLVLAGFVALADGMARAQLADALSNLPHAGARAIVQMAGAGD